MRTRSVLPPVLALALAACDLAPHYTRPSPFVPPAWPTGDAYAPNPGEPAGLSWRQVFTDAKLATLIGRALQQNQNLAVSVANVAAAQATYRAQRSLQLPTLAASASGSFAIARSGGTTTAGTGVGTTGAGTTGTGTTGTGTIGTGASGITATGSGGVDAGVGISAFTLDLFGRQRNLTRQAFEQYLATDAGYRSARLTLIGAVASGYAQLAADRDLLAIARQTAASSGKTVELLTLELNAGLASRTDVANAQTLFATARSDVANQTTLVAQDQNALALLVGGPVAADLLPAGLSDLDRSVQVTPAGLQSTVLLQRPDVRQAEHQVRAANFNIGAARAAFFPDITLTALAGVASRGLVSLFTGPAFALTAAPAATLPLLGGPNRANLDLARAQDSAAIAQYRYTIQTAFREVADGLARRGTIGEQRAAQRDNVAASTTAYQLLNQEFQVGLGTLFDALTAQRTAYTAQQAQVQTILTDVDSRIQLYQYIGADDGR